MKQKISAGDIILTRNNTFLPRAIRVFMNIYRKRLGLPKRVLYNHVAVVIDLWGDLYVAEAAERGIQGYSKVEDYLKNNKCKVKTFLQELTEEQKREFSKIATKYMLKPTRYEFTNFIFQAIYVSTGKWYGKTDNADKRFYCSEYAAMLIDHFTGYWKGKTYKVNPLDIDLCYKLKDKHLCAK